MGTKTLAEWRRALMPLEVEALNDIYPLNPDEPLTANEVFDAIVAWNGGFTSGYHIRSVISRVYGKELE